MNQNNDNTTEVGLIEYIVYAVLLLTFYYFFRDYQFDVGNENLSFIIKIIVIFIVVIFLKVAVHKIFSYFK